MRGLQLAGDHRRRSLRLARNHCVGDLSVSTYLENNEDDRLLSMLPLSFDAGLSQLSTAFYAGACCVLVNYLLPRDIVQICANEKITGITGVPPLWIQLAQMEWDLGGSKLKIIHTRFFPKH